ncbi:atlastin-3-like [Haemaphysalis longicornis]
MAHQRDIGRPIPILRREGGSRFTLDIGQLERILLDDNVKNLPVVVVSVAGAFRKGKSFLLNFFLQYMRNRTKDQWMEDCDAPLKGFPWRGGSEPETMGILMWDEVFVVTTTEGKRMAVVFLDTQGMFDGRSTLKSWTTISAFSIIASSVQIFNLSQNIGEDELQYLQVFTEYGRLALQTAGEKPFQNLLFVVRDWPYAYEKPYGFEGGSSLLEQRLSGYDKQAPELQLSRRDIRSNYSDISCFLMPHPGKKVALGQLFDGCLSDIGEDFKEQLRVLVPSVLDETKLLVKRINDSDMTCQQLLTSLQELADVFNSGDLPDPKSIIEATAETSDVTAATRAFEHYRSGMEEVFNGSRSYLDADFLHEQHLRLRESSLDLLVKAPNISGKPISHEHKERLLALIDQRFESFSKSNEGHQIMAESEKITLEGAAKTKEILEKAGLRVDENGENMPVETHSGSQELEENACPSRAAAQDSSNHTRCTTTAQAFIRGLRGVGRWLTTLRE